MLKNVGIVCGGVSNNLVVIDLDGKFAIDLFKAAFGDLMAQTFTVKTGSGGLHVYLHCDTLPDNRKVNLGEGHSGIEIRGEGQYVVAVPSVHPDTGKKYEIQVMKPVLRVAGLWNVQKWLDGLETPEKAVSQQKPVVMKDRPSIECGSTPVLKDRSGHPVRNPKAYARIALSDECHFRVARAPHGNQNRALYQGAQRMGQFINMGLLTQAEVVRALSEAARQWSGSDQTERQILATIASGLDSNAGGDTR